MYIVLPVLATLSAVQCFGSSGSPRLSFPACQTGHMILVHDAFQGISQVRASFHRYTSTKY